MPGFTSKCRVPPPWAAGAWATLLAALKLLTAFGIDEVAAAEVGALAVGCGGTTGTFVFEIRAMARTLPNLEPRGLPIAGLRPGGNYCTPEGGREAPVGGAAGAGSGSGAAA